MVEKFFLIPFANSGTKAEIPNASQPDGNVSYTDGFTIDYQLEQGTDPDAKDIPRDKFNELIYQMQVAIRQLQTASVPSFITTAANGGSPFSYAKSVRVQYDDGGGNEIYESLVDANTALPTDATKWAVVTIAPVIPDASETVKGILELATAAEAIGGSDSTRAVTSAGLAAYKNLSGQGYMRFPGGLIIQWGTATFTTAGTSNTFPIAFPSAVYSLAFALAEGPSVNTWCAYSNLTLSGFQGNLNSSATRSVKYIAVGI